MKRLILVGVVAVITAGCVPYEGLYDPAYYDDPNVAHAQAFPPTRAYDPFFDDPYWARRQYGYGYAQGWYPRQDDDHRHKRQRLHIDGAVYQSENGPGIDATRYVRKECQGERDCDVKAKNKIFGDPDIGAHKDLIINYRCGRGPQQTLRVPEKSEMDIEC